MQIRLEAWRKYIAALRKCSDEAASRMLAYLAAHPGWEDGQVPQALVDYAAALVSRYGEGAAEAACEMYDAIAAASGVALPTAEPAEVAAIRDVAKAVQGTALTGNAETVGGAVSRLVKLAGVDTTAKNAIRDGAEWAWVPSGDTCAFCLSLASRGWQRAKASALEGGHAKHVHANCDCTYAVRFNSDTEVGGYIPEEYRGLYEAAPGGNARDKINALRREFYAENRDKINAQKRSAYARRQALNSSAAEELDVE